MTETEIKVALALGACSFQPGAFDKGFARATARRAEEEPDKPLTDKGRHWLWKLAWKYRRQLPADVLALVPAPEVAKPMPQPKARLIRPRAGAFFLKASK